MRLQDRKNEELRPVKITRNYLKYAEGSALIEMGNTKVICAASVEENVPHWMKGGQKGWVTAEYSLLPRSTHSRNAREAARGRISGRTYEIQRLIGRSLRSVVDMHALGERTVWLDCDVLQADGGTRTAAITGAFVALADAFDLLHREKKIEKFPLTDFVAAISVGIFKGEALLDLSYEEDSQADVDMNIVMTGSEELVEVQGTAEKKPFTRNELNNLIDLGVRGINMLINIQKESLGNIADKISRSGKKKLILATRNEGKKEELKKMLSALPFTVYSLGDFPELPEVEETGSTFTENAILKAETISHLTGEMVLADDSGLEVMHLEGRPGVYSARFAGDGATDEENNALLLELMQEAAPSERKARFVCVMALAVPGKETQTVEGICEGVLASAPRGSRGFGYDPLFIYEKEGKTFGELDLEAKSNISHRGRAMQKLRDLLKIV